MEASALINPERLVPWLDANLPELGDRPLKAELLAGGMSNAVFRIDRGKNPMVLRRPPAQPRPDSAKSILREARVLRALVGTDVPTPRFRASCEDRDVIGAVFYIMDFVEGWLGWPPPGKPQTAPPPFDEPGSERRALGFALVDGIAKLANVDYLAIALQDFGKPDNFLERQVDRWLRQLASYRETENYEGRDIPGLAYAADWLRANTPEMSPAGILHGDYSFGNAMFKNQPPARLAAMIDWELATIGDPLLDLGWVLYGFNGRGDKTPSSGYFDPTDFPYREELADYYAERTGRSLENITYYMVLAQFKLASIMEGHVARAMNGRQAVEHLETSDKFVRRLALKAEEMARAAP
jgi:aminoglycoside phosphotransferase (APT) family kinase protein